MQKFMTFKPLNKELRAFQPGALLIKFQFYILFKRQYKE